MPMAIADSEQAFPQNPHNCMLHMQRELSLSQDQSANAHARHDAVEALAVPGCHRAAGSPVPPPAHLDSEPPATIVLCVR